MSSVNASVTLTLTELDSLRNHIKIGKEKQEELQSTIKDLESKQKQIKVRIDHVGMVMETRERYEYRGGGMGGYRPTTYQEAVKKVIGTDVHYINFEDVQSDLTLKAEARVQDAMTQLKNEKTRLSERVSLLEAEQVRELSELNMKHLKKIDEFEAAHELEVKRLDDVIKTLRNQEIEKTKDAKIEALQAEIEALKAKRWWQF